MSTRRPAKMPRRVLRKDSSLNERAGNLSSQDKKAVHLGCELTYDVLTIIFKNLNARDLRRAAQVCRCWSEAAENEKRVRGCSVLASFGDLNNSWNDLHPGKEFVDQLRMKPMLGLIFTRPFDDIHPAVKDDKTDCPCGMLPSTCPNIIVGNYGVVKDRTELEENPQKAACLFLPEEQGVSVQTICVPLEKNEKNEETSHRCRHTSSNAKKLLKKFSTAKNKVKCFIFLSSDDDVCGYDVLEHIPRDRDRTLCGGVAGNLAICKRDENGKLCSKPMSWIGILISGASVRSWSVVLRRRCDTKDKVETKLKLLRNQVQLKKHSMGFMFACQGRGEYMFEEKNVESTIFKKMFPEVPLIGSFGGGEYGDSTVERMESRVHQYSTVFMILTYG